MEIKLTWVKPELDTYLQYAYHSLNAYILCHYYQYYHYLEAVIESSSGKLFVSGQNFFRMYVGRVHF